MGWRENPEPKNPKPNWNPPPQKKSNLNWNAGMLINATIYNLTLMLCSELKRKKKDQDMINRITAILPKLILMAEQNPNQRIKHEDLQKLYKSEEMEL
jgi:hypothetical protein